MVEKKFSPTIFCIKCSKELSKQDSRGWEKLCTNPYENETFIWFCPECILNSQAVKDRYGGRRCERCGKLFVDEEYFKCILENSPHPTQHFVCFSCHGYFPPEAA